MIPFYTRINNSYYDRITPCTPCNNVKGFGCINVGIIGSDCSVYILVNMMQTPQSIKICVTGS